MPRSASLRSDDAPTPLPWPEEPMLARAVERVPSVTALPGGCQYEPKWDGFRGLLGAGRSGIARLRSRRGRDLAVAFPDIIAAASEQLPPGTLLDGELVVWNGDRLDFTQLQRRMASAQQARRLAAAHPASYVMFDVLMLRGEDVTGRPLRERRRLLERLVPALSPPLQLTPATRDQSVAENWQRDYAAAGVGIEGLVVKGLNEPYRPGRRDWLKVRSRDTVDAVVGAVVGSMNRPERVILGLPGPDGVLVIAGSTGPLKPAQQTELAALLQPPRGGHPWPPVIPGGRAAAWGTRDLPVTLVDPAIVVEVAADTAYEYGRWRHLSRYLRVRPDLAPSEVEQRQSDG